MSHSPPLAPCPDSPNCVCTLDTNPSRRMEPVRFACSAAEAAAAVVVVLRQEPRTTLIMAEDDYVQAVTRSLVFGFADDVEFQIDADAKLIHFRSAARVGWWDLGVNRRRMKRLTRRLRDRLAASPTGRTEA